MNRLILAAALLFLPSVAFAVDHDVHGYTLPDAAHLEDSILGPGAPVAIAWDAVLNGWKGVGNGVEYRVVKEGSDWKVRAVLPAGDFALAWSLVAYPGQNPTITSPVFRDSLTAAGPVLSTWGTGKVTITLAP